MLGTGNCKFTVRKHSDVNKEGIEQNTNKNIDYFVSTLLSKKLSCEWVTYWTMPSNSQLSSEPLLLVSHQELHSQPAASWKAQNYEPQRIQLSPMDSELQWQYKYKQKGVNINWKGVKPNKNFLTYNTKKQPQVHNFTMSYMISNLDNRHHTKVDIWQKDTGGETNTRELR